MRNLKTDLQRAKQLLEDKRKLVAQQIEILLHQSQVASHYKEIGKEEFITLANKALLPNVSNKLVKFNKFTRLNNHQRDFLILTANWDNPYWKVTTSRTIGGYQPHFLGSAPSVVRVGEVIIKLPGFTTMERSALIPIRSLSTFPGHLAITSNSLTTRQAVLSCLQSLAVRLMATFPVRKMRAVFIDPAGMGNNFPFKNFPEFIVGPKVYTRSDEIREQLRSLTVHIEQVIQKYLSADYSSIEQFNQAKSFIKEPYRYVFIADFPAGFDNTSSLEDLKSLLINGPKAGVYVVLHLDESLEKPRNFDYRAFADYCTRMAPSGDLHNGKPLFQMNLNRQRQVNIMLDDLPSNEQINMIASLVTTTLKNVPLETVPFSELQPSQEEAWSLKSDTEIRTPIGVSGALDRLEFWIGQGEEGRIASQGILAGKPGAGKSYTLHAIIINLASRYSPDELEMYLLDFKEGVEFQVYVDPLRSESTDPSAELDESRALPHAKVISIESDREFGLSVLERVQQEIQRRGQKFTSVGIASLKDFRAKQTNVRMPRILIVIDEFQYMFLNNDEITRKLNVIFEDIARRGRAFGIHLLLATQSPNVPNMNNLIYSFIDLRMVQQMDKPTAARVLAEGNVDAIDLIERPGEIIYNANGGKNGHNVFGHIVDMSLDVRKESLMNIQGFAKDHEFTRPEPLILFNGKQATKLKRNPQLQQLTRMDDWLTSRELNKQVIKDKEWTLEEFPTVAWLGESMKIGGHIHTTFRRRSRNNMLMIGSSEQSIFGMLGAITLSLAHCYTPNSVSFEIMDLSTPDEDQPWTYLTTQLRDAIGNLFEMNIGKRNPDKNNNISRYQTILHKVNDELERRQGIRKDNPDETNFGQPIFFICAIGALERAQDLRPVMGQRNEEPSEDGKTLIKIVSGGSELGIHTILWLDSTTSFLRISADNKGWLTYFDNRVALAMAAEFSRLMIGEIYAQELSSLQAYYRDESKGSLQKFKPYAVPTEAEIIEYGKILNSRRSSEVQRRQSHA